MTLQLDNCCFCGELRIGSLIIGYLTLIRDIIVTLISIIILAISREIRASGIVIAVFCILLLIGLLNVIFTIVLLIGIHQYKNGHMKVYLIFNLVVMVIAVLLILILCIATGLPILILVGLVFLAFHVYYLLIIRSYYLKMDNALNKPAIFSTPEGPPLTAERLGFTEA
ncbi:unnamed protein product [Arctia plantaginis]|uniref:Uncharacterized protein n=1 Tax=Arctia plantaginis TaxID=874455 RepID=A0A8S0Z5R8_ARCPL|nr:unnamed protein product [Arctia plantaginis]CAB3228269.1 unnamed protein product [Arctia plantaginis]